MHVMTCDPCVLFMLMCSQRCREEYFLEADIYYILYKNVSKQIHYSISRWLVNGGILYIRSSSNLADQEEKRLFLKEAYLI